MRIKKEDMLSKKMLEESNILFVQRTRRRSRNWIKVAIFLVVLSALVALLVMLASDRGVPYSFF